LADEAREREASKARKAAKRAAREAFQGHLHSVGGGDKSADVARMHRRNVQRIILDLLEGDAYAPACLRRLLTIDRKPDGLLERMQTRCECIDTLLKLRPRPVHGDDVKSLEQASQNRCDGARTANSWR
jgi:hypothetical protein